MPIVTTNKRRVKKYVIGGSGIFDTVAGFFKRLFTSDAARRIGQAALIAGTDVGKQVGKTALDVGKSTAIEAGKRLVNKVAAKILAPASRVAPAKAMHTALPSTTLPGVAPPMLPPGVPATPALTPKSREILNELISGTAPGGVESLNKVPPGKEININNLLSGYGMPLKNSRNSTKAITIQDLVRRLNGTGLKLA